MPSALPGELAWQHCELLGTHPHGRARLPDSFDITSIQHRFSSAIAAVCCFLLLASYFFYGWWDWRFLALMICSTTADFLIARKIDPGRGDANRGKWFICSLVLNFSILGTFKYFNFFVDSFSTALETLGFHNI